MENINYSNTKTEAEEYKKIGNQYISIENYYLAVSYYTKAIEVLSKFKNNAESPTILAIYHSNRSNAYFKLKDYANAMEDAEKCMELNPSWFRGYIRKALIYESQGQFKDYSECLMLALAQNPDEKDKLEILKLKEKNDEFLNKFNKIFEPKEKTAKTSPFDFDLFNDSFESSSGECLDDCSFAEYDDPHVQDQVDFLASQFIKPYEDDAFRALSVYHGVADGALSGNSARRWLKFSQCYGCGDADDLIFELVHYIDNDREIRKTKFQKIFDLCGLII
jgi:tetratricopeptide (TPR) repeat protein